MSSTSTLKERLGDAVDLIDGDQYLPMFRSRQIKYPELFDFSVKLAKSKTLRNRKYYFAWIWAKKRLSNTIAILQKMLNIAKNKIAQIVRNKKQLEHEQSVIKNQNDKGLSRLNELKRSFNLTS